MPYDDLRRSALEALASRREAFHSAVATAVDEVRSLLTAHKAPTDGKAAQVAAELGAFASGRIDAERFAAVFGEQEMLDAEAVERIEAALAALTDVLEAGDALHYVRVASGADLRDAVRTALAKAGRAFGAGRAVENARAGLKGPDYAGGFGPERWNRAERTVAPPLVVDVDGADFRPAGLADYLDGGQALVLLVRKPAPPAAMARLVAPGVVVAQGADAGVLDLMAKVDGPIAVSVVPEGAALFHYDGDAVDGVGSLQLESVPEEAPQALGSMSASRQEADLALLQLLDGAAAGRVVAAATAPGEAVDPTDMLAAWLLRQANVPAPGEA